MLGDRGGLVRDGIHYNMRGGQLNQSFVFQLVEIFLTDQSSSLL